MEAINESEKLKIAVVGIGDESFKVLESKPKELEVLIMGLGYNKEQLNFLKIDNKFFINEDLKNRISSSEKIQDISKIKSIFGDDFCNLFSTANIVFVLTDLDDTNVKIASILLELSNKNKAIPIPVIRGNGILLYSKEYSKKKFLELKKHSPSFIICEDELKTFLPREYSPFWEKIEGLYLSLALPSLVNIDFADFRTVINKGGPCYIGVGEGKGDRKTSNCYKSALKSIFDLELEDVKGALINIIGNKDLALKESTNVTGHIEEQIHKNAEIIWGVSLNNNSKDILKVVIVLTGVLYPELEDYL